MLKREPMEDALILHPDLKLDAFLEAKGANAKIGTNSVRRAAYLRRLFPGAEIIHYRGAADTRVKKLDGRVLQKLPDGGEVGPADALVMARCGLERIGLAARISHVFSVDEMLPAIGQGIVALECRHDDWKTRERLAAVEDGPTRVCGNAERELLWVLNGHCNAPIAGNAQINAGMVVLRAAVISEDGAKILQCSVSGPKDRAREVGREAGLKLLEQGARKIIEASRPPGQS